MIAGAAKRYARALFALGEERGKLDEISDEVEAFAFAWGASRELRQILGNPLFPIDRRRAIVRELARKVGLSDIATHAMLLLLDRSRLGELPQIVQRLRAMVDEKGGRVRAEVVSAAPLAEATVRRLKAELEGITGRSVVLTHREDPSLIAGIVTRVGDRLYDGSARARLTEIREILVEQH